MPRFGIFCLILFILFILYFFGGMAVMKYRGASGFELIPNFYIWSSLPGNLKRGFCYVWNGCRSEDSYERI